MVMPGGNFASSPPSALTTTKPSPASAMTNMNRIATEATTDAGRPSSRRAISPSDLPSDRTETVSTSMSCTAPAKVTPISSQTNPGK